jgi:hypothetical protein
LKKNVQRKLGKKGKKHREIRKIEGQIGELKIGLPSRKERIQKGKRTGKKNVKGDENRGKRLMLSVREEQKIIEDRDLERRKKERWGKDKLKRKI